MAITVTFNVVKIIIAMKRICKIAAISLLTISILTLIISCGKDKSNNVPHFRKISGYVRDAGTSQPIGGASIYIEEQKGIYHTGSDGDGKYEMDILQGNWTIKASKQGYNSFIKSISLDDDLYLDIQLSLDISKRNSNIS